MGYVELLPFLVLALAIWFADLAYRAFSSRSLLAYGAVIDSFLGAIHWGLVMRGASSQSFALLGWGVVPSLVGWDGLGHAPQHRATNDGGPAMGMLCG